MKRLAALLIGACLVAGLAAQTPVGPATQSSTPTGFILGRVVDAATNNPIPIVVVGLAGAPNARSVSALTDAQGRFLFRNVAKGSYTLRATTGGNGYSPSGFMVTGSGMQIGPYLNGGFGQRRPGGSLQAIDLGDGERIGDVVIRLWKGASIDGTVLDEAGEPLVNVVVAAAKRSTDGRLLTGPTVRTDDRGAYHIGTLLPGDYVVVVPQFQAAMPSTTGDSIATAPDRVMTSKLANTSASSVAGGIVVRDMTVSTAVENNTSAIAPSPRGDALYVYQTTFAPAATSATLAGSVTLLPGEERTGVNVLMQPVRGVSVSGTLVDDAGPVPQFGVRLMPREGEDGSEVIDVASTSTDARGRFTFPLVPPGAYRVIARRLATTRFADGPQAPQTRLSDRAGNFTQQEIVVSDRDLSGVALQLRPGVQVSGHVEFRGSGNQPAADRLRQFSVIVSPMDPISRSFITGVGGQSAPLDANGNFVVRDVVPGRYRLWTSEPSGWTLEAVSIAGRDVLDRAVTIENADIQPVSMEVTDRPAEISGTVRNRAGSPDSDAGVLVFPTDRSRWRDARTSVRSFRAVRVSKSGAFTAQPMLPGEYFIVAVPDEATADFPDVKFLGALSLIAQTIRIAAGEKQTLPLTTAAIQPARTVAGSTFGSRSSFGEEQVHGPMVADDGDVVAPGVVAPAPVLSGLVTTSENPIGPVRHAVVTATGNEIGAPRQTVTDDEGRFALSDLPPGRYSIVVDKPGYVKTFYGSKRPGRPPGTPVAIAAGQPAPNITIRLPRGAVIAGTVRDQFGGPVASSQVSVQQPIVVNGQRKMVDVPNLLVPRVTTDDKGRYRIYGLPAGEYAVRSGGGSTSYFGVPETNSADVDVALQQIRGMGTPASANAAPSAPPRQVTMAGGYFPGVPDADSAQLIAVGSGEERVGVDIVTRLVRSARVEGTALGPGGAPMQNVMVAIVNAGDRTLWGSPGLVRPGADGRFVIGSLTPGHYALAGRAGENGAPEGTPMCYAGEVDFFVTEQDVSGIVLQFERGTSVAGRIVPQAGATRTFDPTSIRLGIAAVDSLASFGPTPPAAKIQPDGSFRFDCVGSGKWRVTATLSSGWSLRSAISNGRDVLDVPLELRQGQALDGLTVTLTDRPTELTGTFFDATGQPTSEYSMLAFSTDRSLWTTAPRRISGAVRLSSDGRFRMAGLPPGEYYLTAIVDFDSVQLGDPSFLESLIPGAAKVTLGEGERKNQDFRTGGS